MHAAILLAVVVSGVSEVELFRGKTVAVERETEFMFRTGTDKYFTLKSTLAIRTEPTIAAPKGLTVKILSSSVEETTLSGMHIGTEYQYRRRVVTTGTGKGYRIRCKVQLSSEKGLPEGQHKVELSWPGVSVLARQLKANTMDAPSRTIAVDFWESAASKKAHLDAVAARKASEAFWGWMRVAAWVGGIVGFFVAWRWIDHGIRWMCPTRSLKVKVGAGEHFRTTLVKEIPIKEEDLGKPVEPLVETKAAVTYWGGTSGVMVTCHGYPVDAEFSRTLNTLTRNGTVVSSWFSYSAKVTYDIAVSAEAKVGTRPVAAVAETEVGRVKVRVVA